VSAPTYLMSEEQWHVINRALLTAISIAGIHAPGVQKTMLVASADMDAIADAPSLGEVAAKLEPFATLGEMLTDEDGWSDRDELYLEADPDFGRFATRFATIKASAFRDAFKFVQNNGLEVSATHRHVKRGSEYVLLGIGKMQAENWMEPEAAKQQAFNTVDMREVAIYRSVDDGSLWVRPREEFEDGRFQKLEPVKE